MYDRGYLKELQAMPLELKIMKTRQRIFEFVMEFGCKQVYVSYSGGKDSTVLLHLVREQFPRVQAVFFNTGVEYPDLVEHVRDTENVVEIKPKRSMHWVLRNYGYPVVSKEISQRLNGYFNGRKPASVENAKNAILGYDASGKKSDYKTSRYTRWKFLLDAPFSISHRCCTFLKKNPAATYEKETVQRPIIGTLASESAFRLRWWREHGCNAFGRNGCARELSQPLSFWTEQDVLQYVQNHNLVLPKIYGEIETDKKGKLKCTGQQRTGCMFCGFGCHQKDDTRWEVLEQNYPQMYDYAMRGGEFVDGKWMPSKGLGLGYVINWIKEQKEKSKCQEQ